MGSRYQASDFRCQVSGLRLRNRGSVNGFSSGFTSGFTKAGVLVWSFEFANLCRGIAGGREAVKSGNLPGNPDLGRFRRKEARKISISSCKKPLNQYTFCLMRKG